MKRDYIRVAPTSEHHADRDVPRAIATLHSIWADQSVSFFDRLVPTRSGKKENINFTFYILSVGEDEPVEMYYHVDKEEHMSTLKARLKSIYPSTFQIEEVYRDITGRLIEPVEYSREEYLDRLASEDLFYDVMDDNQLDMTRKIPDTREPLDIEGPNPHRLPREPVDTQMLKENGRFLDAGRVAAHINRLDRVPDEQPLNILRRPTVASLTDPPSDVATDGGGAATDTGPTESRTINSGYLGEAGEKLVDSVYARPPIDELTPVGVRWKASENKPGDYMTSLTRFDDSVYTSASADETEAHKGEPPLTTILEYITQASQPLALQIRFSPMEPWTEDFQDRQDEIQQVESSSDSLLADFFSGMLDWENNQQPPEEPVYHDEPAPHEPIDPPEGSHNEARLEMMEEKQDRRSFIVNMDAFSILGPNQTQPSPELDDTLTRLETAFQAFDGREYEVVGERIGQGLRSEKDRMEAFENFEQHLITVDDPSFWKFWSSDTLRKDFVLDPHELANFIVIPHTDHLSAEATRGIRAQQQSQSPLPRPNSDIMRKLRGALEVGHALDQENKPESKPVGIPVSSLTKHYVRFAATGGGKSIAAQTDQLSLSRNTSGPIFNIDAKGGGYLKNYMRAYQAEFGKEALEEDILYYNFPDELPGISFFDIRNAYTEANDSNPDRKDAVQDVADHFVEIIKVVFGRQRFEEAKTAGSLIRYLIKLLFDEKHAEDHGYNRESVDFFSYRDLEWLISRIEEVANSGEYHRLPRTTTGQIEARIHKRIANNPDSFLNSLEGIKSRLDEIFQDPRLREIFNNTSPELDFAEILDSDKQVLFDLGDLRDKSAETVTAVLMMTLFDTLQNHDLSDKPDDYLVNLQVDEAAKVVVSKPMRKFLKEGREFRLCVGLMTQFSKQMEYEGTRGVYMNVLNNVRTTLASTITMDEELAESFAHEDMEAMESKHRLRGMASGEWMIKTLNPQWGGPQPQPFNIRAKDIPAGHPESDDPLTDDEEADFQETVAAIRERAANEYGVVDNEEVASLTVPPSVQDLIGCSERIGHLLANAIGGVQLDVDGDARSENAPVRAGDVREKVHDYYVGAAREAKENDDVSQADESRKEHRPPSHEVVVETARNRTELVDVTIGDSAEVRMQLSDAGEDAIKNDTGDVPASGGEDHDAALDGIEHALGSEGFTVNVLEQDGSEMPDAKAVHPALDTTLILEAETTTPTKPPKVLENLKKAQRMDGIPVFVVEPGEDDVGVDEAGEDDEFWARRVENILDEPVKKTEDETGIIHYYVSDYPVRINGKVPAVRPTTSDKRRTNWTRENGELVMRDGDDNEHVRTSNLEDLGSTDVPAVDMYDEYADKHTVDPIVDEEETYTDEDNFDNDWVPIKRPVIPDELLPNPEYDRDDYHILILSREDSESPVFYRDGETFPLSPEPDDPVETFEESADSSADTAANETASSEGEQPLNNPADQPSSEPATEMANGGTSHESGTESDDSVSDESDTKETPDEELGGKDEGVVQFVDARLIQSDDSAIPTSELYDQYEEYALEHNFETRNRQQFSRSVNDNTKFNISSEVQKVDGETKRVYPGVDLVFE
jgi:DNA helicase HerA-like ATPase